MADIFVSYASEDRDRIQPLVELLEQKGWSVWWDRDLVAGPSFEQRIERALEAARCVVVAWSEHSIESRWCRAEATDGIERGMLVPILIDDVRPPLQFRGAHTPSLVGWPEDEREVPVVLAGIRECLGVEQPVQERTGDRGVAPSPKPESRARVRILLAALACTIAVAAVWWSTNNARVAWALEEALPDMVRLANAGEYVAAYRIAMEAKPFIPAHPLFVAQLARITSEVSIRTNPEGARVSYKPYDDVDGDWVILGEAPIDNVRLPRGAFRWRLEKPGYVSKEIAVRVADPSTESLNAHIGRDWRTINIDLTPTDEAIPGMVAVPGRRENVDSPMPLPTFDDFMIDVTEVTNEDFQEFVDAGGYGRSEFWREPFVRNGETLTFEAAMVQFRDKTDRPGPATWIMSRFPRGTEHHPVSGVSWFEAAAYARFRGKALPTVHHWQRAAWHDNDWLEPLTPFIVSASNFAGEDSIPVASAPAISAYGAYDMAGNVAEWVWNEGSDGERYLVGGSWPDAPVLFNAPIPPSASPWERQPTHGFRCVNYEGGSVDQTLLSPLDLPELPDFRNIPTRPDQVFEAEALFRSYDATPLNARVESAEASPYGGRYERVSLDAAYLNERLLIDLHLPEHARPPYQAVVWVGAGGRVALQRAREEAYLDATDFFVESGRVLVNPILAGTYERQGQDTVASRFRSPNQRREILVQWTKDIRRTLDYLETREDIDGARVAFVALSGGALYSMSILPHEPRFKALSFWGLGFFRGDFYSSVEFADLARRINSPVLMLNGSFDPLLAVETQVEPMYELFGTAESRKRLVVHEASHWPYPHESVIKENLDWLDRHLGPVSLAGK